MASVFLQRSLALCAAMAVVAFLVTFPVGQVWLALGCAAYAVLLVRVPLAWLVVVPAAMPVLDLAFFSGWFFFDEFDALVLLTAAVLYWRAPLRRGDSAFGWPLGLLVTLLCISYAASAAIALLPLPEIDGNSFASYYSRYNALRIAKGIIWSLLLLPHLARAIRQFQDADRVLAGGFLLGLFLMSLVALYEHFLFVGMFNFDHEYRIIGPFSSMHTGDGHIDLWLATTIPLISIVCVGRWPRFVRAGAVGLAVLGFYILLATASRGPFLATVAAGAVLAIGFGIAWMREGTFGRAMLVWPMVGIVGILATAPFLFSTELANRFGSVQRDLNIRLTHFQSALEMRDGDFLTRTFGMGLGTFPATYEQRKERRQRLSRYSFDGPPGHRHLTLWSGSPMFISQWIEAEPHTSYLVTFRYRMLEERAAVHLAICEKWLLHSGRCSRTRLRLASTGGRWEQVVGAIRTESVGSPAGRIGWPSVRPVRFTIYVSGASDGLSLDNISVVAPDGRDLVRNGRFEKGNDFWFWTVDDHLPWHTKNMAVNILFDQGWFGIVAVTLLAGVAMILLIRAVAAGNQHAVPWLAAMTGYLANGLVVSSFDQPRLAMLFYLLCFCVILRFGRTTERGRVA